MGTTVEKENQLINWFLYFQKKYNVTPKGNVQLSEKKKAKNSERKVLSFFISNPHTRKFILTRRLSVRTVKKVFGSCNRIQRSIHDPSKKWKQEIREFK